jgi:hypothetical protein
MLFNLPNQGLPLQLLQSSPVALTLAHDLTGTVGFRCIDSRYGELIYGTEFTTSVRFPTDASHCR